MSIRIALINVNRCSTPYPVYPLGMCHVASAAARAGHETLVLDLSQGDEEVASRLTAFKPDLVGLSLRNIDDVNITRQECFVPHLYEGVKLCRLAASAPVVVGGSAYSLFPRELLDAAGADYGIRGEGERALPALAEALAGTRSFETVPGLVWRDENAIRLNEPENEERILTPPPHLEPGLVSHYLAESSMLSVQTQRGCPYRCCYCTYPLLEGRRPRFRDPKAVADELARGVAGGARYFFVVDSVFNTDADHAAAVCNEIIRQNLDISWGCFLRPRGLTQELMELMSKAGLTHIEFGTDSMCDSVLEAYAKGFTFDDILASSELARKNSVHYAHFLALGGPGESERTLRESAANSRQLKRTAVFAFVGLRLYPGTPLHARAIAEGVISPSTDLLAPHFYLNASLERERVETLIAELAAESPNWVFGEIEPAQQAVARKLRAKGLLGPLWEFLVRP